MAKGGNGKKRFVRIEGRQMQGEDPCKSAKTTVFLRENNAGQEIPGELD
jgi:hypothetical protein